MFTAKACFEHSILFTVKDQLSSHNLAIMKVPLKDEGVNSEFRLATQNKPKQPPEIQLRAF